MKKSAERSGQPNLGKERDAPSAVAWDGCAIAEDEPPAFVTLLLRDFGQQTVGLLIGERKQRQFVVPVDGGDDPRRPTAEPSATGIEENRAREWELRGDTRAHVLWHPQDYATARAPAVWLSGTLAPPRSRTHLRKRERPVPPRRHEEVLSMRRLEHGVEALPA